MYNKTPEWPIPNPDAFASKLMQEITNIVTELRERNYDFDQNISQNQPETLSYLALKISNLIESTKGILNVFALHGYNPMLLTNTNLTTIAHLLDVKSELINVFAK